VLMAYVMYRNDIGYVPGYNVSRCRYNLLRSYSLEH
jgi:hypothetical protein